MALTRWPGVCSDLAVFMCQRFSKPAFWRVLTMLERPVSCMADWLRVGSFCAGSSGASSRGGAASTTLCW